jgi:hypothetical protein
MLVADITVEDGWVENEETLAAAACAGHKYIRCTPAPPQRLDIKNFREKFKVLEALR